MACVEECSTADCTSSPPSLERLEERETEPWREREREREREKDHYTLLYTQSKVIVLLLVYPVVQTAFVSVTNSLGHTHHQQQQQ